MKKETVIVLLVVALVLLIVALSLYRGTGFSVIASGGELQEYGDLRHFYNLVMLLPISLLLLLWYYLKHAKSV